MLGWRKTCIRAINHNIDVYENIQYQVKHLIMPGHYKKTANQSSRTIVAGHRIKLDNQEEGLLTG